MSNFATCIDPASASAFDPAKHVNFTPGMVLGVDDFRQEFAYHAGRDQTLARELCGYGTISGLRVSVRQKSGQTAIAVEPGLALTPAGEFVRILRDQCASLGDWLARHAADIPGHEFSTSVPPQRFARLYVTLAYRSCPVDAVPIPGEPCRTEAEAMQPSRLKDDYVLELSFHPPDQREENAIRDVVAWLRQVRLIPVGASDPVSSVDDVLDALRAAAHDLGSPPTSPPLDFLFGSPPGALAIPAADSATYWRAVFRLWVTELRPLWQARLVAAASCGCGEASGTGATSPAPAGYNLLLAEIHAPLTATNALGNPALIVIDESIRPCVLHIRFLQEWLLNDASGITTPTASSGGSIVIQYSTNGTGLGAGAWHTAFATGDQFMRISVGGGPFSAPMRFVGPAGANGTNGAPGTPGAPGASVTIEYSIDGSGTATGPWHPVYAVGDQFMHVRVGGGSFSIPMRFVGPPGANGTNGAPGTPGAPGASVTIEYSVSGTGGWHATYVAGDQFMQLRIGTGPFTAPMRFVGPQGPAGTNSTAGDFVERADPGMAYRIVGAGIFNQAGAAAGPVYNNTKVTPVSAGVYDVIFDNFQRPPATNPKFVYILKATPLGKVEFPATIHVDAARPLATGIRFTALMGAPTSPKPLPGFMLEISQFG
ncbi:MAG TPA: collagen-like protein [Lacunisphaera sp.]|nr:collagen-like protein [Lacunisphaera sp.]